MARKKSPRTKSPAELNSRVIRVSLDDYLLITGLSRKLGKTMAEVLHLLITDRVPHTVAYRTTPVTAVVTSGNKGIAVGIKPKGVKYA